MDSDFEGPTIVLLAGDWRPQVASYELQPTQVMVEVWHMRSFSADAYIDGGPAEALDRSKYVLAGAFVAEGIDEDLARDLAYAHSQNDEEPWRPDERVRSTSVGDVLVLRRPGMPLAAWRVEVQGFAPVERFVEFA